MDIGKKLYELRIKRNLSGNKLSVLSGISQSAISAIELGQKSPTVATLISLCNALGVTLSEFFSRNEGNSDPLPAEYVELVKNAKSLSPEQLKILNDFIKNF